MRGWTLWGVGAGAEEVRGICGQGPAAMADSFSEPARAHLELHGLCTGDAAAVCDALGAKSVYDLLMVDDDMARSAAEEAKLKPVALKKLTLALKEAAGGAKSATQPSPVTAPPIGQGVQEVGVGEVDLSVSSSLTGTADAAHLLMALATTAGLQMGGDVCVNGVVNSSEGSSEVSGGVSLQGAAKEQHGQSGFRPKPAIPVLHNTVLIRPHARDTPRADADLLMPSLYT